MQIAKYPEADKVTFEHIKQVLHSEIENRRYEKLYVETINGFQVSCVWKWEGNETFGISHKSDKSKLLEIGGTSHDMGSHSGDKVYQWIEYRLSFTWEQVLEFFKKYQPVRIVHSRDLDYFEGKFQEKDAKSPKRYYIVDLNHGFTLPEERKDISAVIERYGPTLLRGTKQECEEYLLKLNEQSEEHTTDPDEL